MKRRRDVVVSESEEESADAAPNALAGRPGLNRLRRASDAIAQRVSGPPAPAAPRATTTAATATATEGAVTTPQRPPPTIRRLSATDPGPCRMSRVPQQQQEDDASPGRRSCRHLPANAGRAAALAKLKRQLHGGDRGAHSQLSSGDGGPGSGQPTLLTVSSLAIHQARWRTVHQPPAVGLALPTAARPSCWLGLTLPPSCPAPLCR